MEVFSWKRIFKVVGVIVLAGAVIGGAYFFVTWRPVKIAWASFALDRKDNYLPCHDLPFYPQVEKAWNAHQDAVAKVNGIIGVNDFYPEEIKCPAFQPGNYFIKGQLVVTYQNRQARNKAESLLGKDFFGIPYRGEQIN